MLTLAGIIAIAVVITDSTAIVVGAMIIAPQGTPSSPSGTDSELE